MSNFDISSSFITQDLLDKCYEGLNIDTKAEPEYVDIGHPLDYAYQSTNQITTVKKENDNLSQNVMSYASAQNYYQSERAGMLGGPELAEQVRVSKNPYKDGWAPSEGCSRSKVGEWKEHKYDVAFKCNWMKFNQNQDLADQLLRTGNRPIVSRTDNEWSEDNAKMLSVIREDLRRRR